MRFFANFMFALYNALIAVLHKILEFFFIRHTPKEILALSPEDDVMPPLLNRGVQVQREALL